MTWNTAVKSMGCCFVSVDPHCHWTDVFILHLWLYNQKSVLATNMMETFLLSASYCFLIWIVLWPWSWRWNVSLKCRLTLNGLHDIIFWKTGLLVYVSIFVCVPCWGMNGCTDFVHIVHIHRRSMPSQYEHQDQEIWVLHMGPKIQNGISLKQV
jgi:hypothetical protein